MCNDQSLVDDVGCDRAVKGHGAQEVGRADLTHANVSGCLAWAAENVGRDSASVKNMLVCSEGLEHEREPVCASIAHHMRLGWHELRPTGGLR